MRLSCLQENLSKGLAVVGRAVPTRTTLPITQNVLLATDRSMLKLSATNLELAITTWVGAMVEEEGSVTVPARLLSEFVGSLPAERIDVSMEPGQATLRLACARNDARVNGIAADEFPPIPTVDEGLVAKVDAQALRTAINQVVFAAATEESRPVLTGVKLEMEESQFTMAAADGFRLAVHRGELLEPVGEPVSTIVPARTFNELNRFLSDQEDPVEMTVTQAKGQVLFRLTDVEVVSQLIQGTFPNYSQLIPQSYQTRTVFGLQGLLRAARSASIFARDGSGIVRLQVVPGAEEGSGEDGAGRPGKVVISARAEEMGDNQDEVDTLVEGGESKIAFNSKYLLDVLQVMNLSEVALETSSPSSPGVFKPTDSDSYVHVVMPMFVQW
ncbi:MAG: DNA polymerase III subunit beta [Dehalococcoidia bacterium]|nr:DNA polymerase III subunit beta [Dehalococcoidia bacterium]